MYSKAEVVKHLIFLLAYTVLLATWIVDIVANNTLLFALDMPGILLTSFGVFCHIDAIRGLYVTNHSG